MNFDVDPALAVPIYQQIVEQVRKRIGQGVLQPGDRLPTVREVASSSRVNRNTAAKAFQILEAAGVVETRVGKGTFIADHEIRSDKEKLKAIEAAATVFVKEVRDWAGTREEAETAFEQAWNKKGGGG